MRLYTVIHSRSGLQCILPIACTFQNGGRLVVFIFIIAWQRSSDGRQVWLIGTRPKASRAIEFAINRPTTNIYIYIYEYHFYIFSDYLLLRYHVHGFQPVIRQLPWQPEHPIRAMGFDPSGSWLVIAALDTSVFILPALLLLVWNICK